MHLIAAHPEPRVHKEIDGIPMGILSDGTAYLSGRGLAAVCGISDPALVNLIKNWDEARPRESRIREILDDMGWEGPLFAPIVVDGNVTHAFSADVCTAFLEYYSMWAPRPTDKARHTSRLINRGGLTVYIYELVGADVQGRLFDTTSLMHFETRRGLNNGLLPGRWSPFSESSPVVLACIKAGLPFSEHAMVDISIGQHWATYWKKIDGENTYGPRRYYTHRYPKNYPQPHRVQAHSYLDIALPDFRWWLPNIYVVEKLPEYLKRKAKQEGCPLQPEDIKPLLMAVRRLLLGDGR